MDNFTFEIDTVTHRFETDAILENLRAFAATRTNQPCSTSAFNAWPLHICRANTIANRFRGWQKALIAAGIQPHRPFQYSDEELFDYLESLWREIRRRPRDKDLRARGRCHQPYQRRWGSLKNACILLAKHKNGHLTRDQLLNSHTPKPPARTPLRPSTRHEILKRDHYRCTLCGASPATNLAITLEVDHIEPVSRGGTNDPTNLRTLCKTCNLGKGAT